MIQLDKREAFPFSSNPFGLVYENAITENKENEVQIHPITYQLNGIKIASNIYTPKNYSKDKRYPAMLSLFLMEQLKSRQLDFMDKDLLKKDILQLSLIACFLVKVKECQDNKIFLIIA